MQITIKKDKNKNDKKYSMIILKNIDQTRNGKKGTME